MMDNNIFNPYYKELLAQEYHFWRETETKPVWQWIREKRLTVCPSFKGKRYGENKNFRLMVVGRAVNGWSIPNIVESRSLEDVLSKGTKQEFSFNDIIDEKGIEQEDGSRYYYSRSRFWKLIRNVLEEAGEGENFHKKIVWSNLYKVSPYKSGNPGWSLVKPKIETHIELLIEEMRAYKPTHILFVTGMDYLNPWSKDKSMPSFGETLGLGTSDKFEGDNYEVGEFEGAKLVVCGRPELKSDDDIREMAKEILSKFNYKTEDA